MVYLIRSLVTVVTLGYGVRCDLDFCQITLAVGLVFSSFHELMQSHGVRRPSVCLSVCLSVCKHFAQIASSTTEMAGSPPNLHTMVPRRARIQDVLKVKVKVKGHVMRTLL